jgi:hypothetical protein
LRVQKTPAGHRGRFFAATIAVQSSREFTDLYLAELAEQHRMKLATLRHPHFSSGG